MANTVKLPRNGTVGFIELVRLCGTSYGLACPGDLGPSGDPSREDEADGNDAGEDYWHYEEVFPA